jgi:hypothetical protein
MFRTWFGLYGFCKLPWNDIVPADNKYTDEPAKVPEHVQNYLDVVYGVAGKKLTVDDMIKESERVYNFQKIFNIRMGKGLRRDDRIPYRSAGPVTKEEYESRQERYDKQLRKFDTLTCNIKELANWLLDNDCEMVAMESTGAYWKPIYNILELFGLDVMVVNAHHMRHVSTLHAVVTPILGLSIYFLLLLYLIMYFANLMPIYLYNYS